MTTSIKFLTSLTLAAAVLLALAPTTFAGSPIQHAYLVPWGAGVAAYPEASAKLTRNCDTGEVLLRGHGLEAGKSYELRSGGDLPGDPEEAVGNGTAGRGNNVLIKDIKEDESGSFWNLWVGNTRILRAPKVVCE